MREKVRDAARELGLDIVVTTLGQSTKTVRDAAVAVGCDEAMIAKSIVVVCDGEPVVCVTSGAHRVDIERVADARDCAEARMAGPDEVRAATGYPVGGVPPFGHGLPVLLDEALLGHEQVWAAGGDSNSLFEVDPHELVRCTSAQVVALGAGA
ncbi:MAG TPA: YbaK/EbsC family protein [Thermoleophilaceae bacterium]|nr:YbaK/EbsC family protein [Thermoleophilaceae bacterium]